MPAEYTKEEAQLSMRLVNAWSSTQTTVDHLRSILLDMGLLNANDGLKTDRIIELAKRARG